MPIISDNLREYLTSKKFLIIICVLLLMWGSLMVFFYLKADEVTKDPCRICSEYMGEKVTCTLQYSTPVNRYYYPNGSVTQDQPRIIEPDFIVPKNFTIK